MKLQIFMIKKFLRQAQLDLALINVNQALRKDENYHLLVFLKECKYIEKENVRYITEDIKVSSSDFDEK